jgi:DNA-binding response OmpR family regulator
MSCKERAGDPTNDRVSFGTHCLARVTSRACLSRPFIDPMPRTVLVIEDELDISQLVKLHLEDIGCQVTQAFDGIVGLAEAQAKPFDLIVLDLKLPGLDGLEVCKRLRAQGRYTPILMLTSKSSELDRVLGLEIGADDYLTKPFSVMELTARAKAIFRRVGLLGAQQEGSGVQVLTVHDLSIDVSRHNVTVRGNPVELTAKEFDLLAWFARHPGRVYSRDQLLDHVWGYQHSGYDHTVNSHINRLRAKIERDPQNPEYILTVWGVGYKFAEPGAKLEPRGPRET